MKVGFCSLYGLANAGKSTILNAILKTKIEAVSEKPQTTRENIQGIYNDEDSQIVFVDTPGLHDPHKKLGQLMLQEAKSAYTMSMQLFMLLMHLKELIRKQLIDWLR